MSFMVHLEVGGDVVSGVKGHLSLHSCQVCTGSSVWCCQCRLFKELIIGQVAESSDGDGKASLNEGKERAPDQHVDAYHDAEGG